MEGWSPDPGHGATGFGICTSGLQCCFGPVFLHYVPIPPFRMRMHILEYNGSMYLFFNFTGGSQLGETQDFGAIFRLLKTIGIVRLLKAPAERWRGAVVTKRLGRTFYLQQVIFVSRVCRCLKCLQKMGCDSLKRVEMTSVVCKGSWEMESFSRKLSFLREKF